MKLESIFNQMEIPALKESKEETEIEEENESCSKAMMRVAHILFEANGFNEAIFPKIVTILENFPKENFFSAKL